MVRQIHSLRAAGWVFRGEPDLYDEHRSSLGRVIAQYNPGIFKFSQNEADLVNLFRSQAWAHLRPTDETFTSGVFGWLVLMQHHGAPTRLLDWSWSPWVAAYHASSRGKDSDGMIWGFCLDGLSRACSPEERAAGRRFMRAEQLDEWIAVTRDSPDLVLACNVVEQTDRMAAQQGTFTMCNPPWADHLDLIGSRVPPNALRTIRVPAATKPELMQVLAEMNLTAAALYPGLDGAGRRVDEALAWGQAIPHSEYEPP